MPRTILALLGGGDRRSIGCANQVAAMVSNDPALFTQLIAGLRSEDPLVRMRAADAAEKVTRKHHEYLPPHKKELLSLMIVAKLRWHLAVMVPRIPLEAKEIRAVMSALNAYLDDRSSIVKFLLFRAWLTWLRPSQVFDPGWWRFCE
jgi:hypothetical protein